MECGIAYSERVGKLLKAQQPHLRNVNDAIPHYEESVTDMEAILSRRLHSTYFDSLRADSHCSYWSTAWSAILAPNAEWSGNDTESHMNTLIQSDVVTRSHKAIYIVNPSVL